MRRRLNKDWADAVKYEQMYLEFVKESSLEAKELMEPHDSPNPDTRMVWFETAAPADGRVAIRVVFTPGSGR